MQSVYSWALGLRLITLCVRINVSIQLNGALLNSSVFCVKLRQTQIRDPSAGADRARVGPQAQARVFVLKMYKYTAIIRRQPGGYGLKCAKRTGGSLFMTDTCASNVATFIEKRWPRHVRETLLCARWPREPCLVARSPPSAMLAPACPAADARRARTRSLSRDVLGGPRARARLPRR